MDAYVTIPVAESITVFLEDAPEDASDDELFSLALDAADCGFEEGRTTNHNEYEYLKQIVSGNVCYAPVHSFDVEREP